jgi:hypothetical protein
MDCERDLHRLCWHHRLRVMLDVFTSTPSPDSPGAPSDEGLLLAKARACDRCRALNGWDPLAPGEMEHEIWWNRFAATAYGIGILTALFVLCTRYMLQWPWWQELAALAFFCAAVAGFATTQRFRPRILGAMTGAAIALLITAGLILLGHMQFDP